MRARYLIPFFALAALCLAGSANGQRGSRGGSRGLRAPSGRSHSYTPRSYTPRSSKPRTYSSPTPRSSRPRTSTPRSPRLTKPHSSAPRGSRRLAPPATHQHSSSPRAATPHAPGERDSRGRLKRSEEARRDFMRETGHPHGWPGHVIDHIKPLAEGGADDPSNMQWQTIPEAKAKDRVECSGHKCGSRHKP